MTGFFPVAVAVFTALFLFVAPGDTALSLTRPGDTDPVGSVLASQSPGGLAVIFTSPECGDPCVRAGRVWHEASAEAARKKKKGFFKGGDLLFVHVDCDDDAGGSEVCDELGVENVPSAVVVVPGAAGAEVPWTERARPVRIAVRADEPTGEMRGASDIATEVLQTAEKYGASVNDERDSDDNDDDDDDSDNDVSGDSYNGGDHGALAEPAAGLVGVRQLEPAEFDATVRAAPTLIVLFRASWCRECAAAVRAMQDAAHASPRGESVFATVDCGAGESAMDLCARERIHELPEFNVYIEGTRAGPVRGTVDSTALVAAAEDPAEATAVNGGAIAPGMKRVTGGAEGIKAMLASRASRVVVVAFVSGASPGCFSFSPVLEDAAAAVEPSAKVTFLVADCGRPPDAPTRRACARYAPAGYPTVVVFTRRSAAAYTGELDALALARFASARAWIGGRGAKVEHDEL